MKDALVDSSPRQRQTVANYLSSNYAQIHDVESWNQSFRSDIMLAVHSILQFSLIDKLADAVGFPHAPFSTVVHRSPPPEIGDKLSKVSERRNFE